MYGTINHAAVLLISENLKMVKKISAIISMISTKAAMGEWNLKNKIVHQKFKNSCIANIKQASIF